MKLPVTNNIRLAEWTSVVWVDTFCYLRKMSRKHGEHYVTESIMCLIKVENFTSCMLNL